VRGEGCGLVLLKRLSDAARDGDRVLAVIRGTAMNHDGRSNGLTAPHGPSQEAVIRAALASAGVAAEDVGYLEAHGTGTSLGDPIEMEAVAKVLCERRDAAHRLVMGSVKSNIGHLESAAGVAGLIKAVLALQHEQIPATLHLEQPNPYIAWSKIPVDVPTDLTPWPESHRRRIAGVSSFGFSGTNVHVVVEQSPQIVAAEAETERHCQMLALSAKDGEALSELAARYAERLQASATSENASDFADVCHTAACGRMHFAHRIALVAKDAAEAVEKLSQFRAGSRAAGVLTGRVDPQRPPKIAFLFSGQGAQYAGMARELFESQPTFRRALALCDEILRDELPHSLLKTLFGEPPAGANGAGSRLDQTLYTQPALFAVEYALYELWRSWGVEPQFLLGHSVGEFVAAVAAEVLSLDDALRLIAARARLMQALPSDGEMTAVAADEPTVRANLGAAAERIDIAALNSPRQTVISGPADAMRDAVVALEESGLPTTRLKVSHAFHSRMMEPVLDEFEQLCRQVKFSPPRIPIASNVHGRIVGDETATPEYWRQQIRRAVRFVEGVTALDASGADVFIEIGPKPLLATAGRQCLADRGQLWLPSLRPGRGDWSQLLESLAELYVRGVEIDWRGFDRDYARRLVDLPNYPFQRARYWFDEPPNGEEVEARRNRAAGAAQPEPSVAKSSGESFHDWLFELQWQPRSRLDQALHRTPPEFVPSAAELRAATDYEAERVREQLELPRYRKLLVELDQLSGAYVWWAFDTLGWRSDELSDDSAEALADRLGVAPTRRRLFGRLLDILAADGHVKRTIRSWAACGLPPPEHPTETADRLLDEYPECAAELTLLGNCGSGLAGVLSGEIDALQLLFPDGSVELVEKLYRDSPFARTLNSLLEETVARVIRDLPAGRTLRILEIGAGTGAATTNLLPRLPADRTEYWFTDVSQVFTREAAGKFRRFPFVRFGVLDIESDTAAQGFAPHQFDLVIAANVLHATRNVRESLAHVRELLVDGGGLVLLEGTRPQRWLDLIFGLTDGWWRFEDRDLRPAHPLISADQWRRSLMECGFAEADVMPAGEFVAVEASASADPAPPQAVVFGRASANHVASAGGEIPPAHAGAAVESNGAAAGDKRSWLILADRSGIGEALAAALRSAGRRVALVQQGDETRAVAAGRHTLRSVEELSRVLTLEGVPHASKLQGVVHLWALDAATPDELTAAKLEQARRLGSESAIALVQQLQPLAGPAGPRLHFVTRGAQPAGDEQRMSGLAQAPLWGVGRVLAEEHPSLWGGLIDLDPALPVDEAARRLCDELLSPDGEDQLALRPHDRFAARLVRRAPHSTAASQLRFRADASYLITGGLGDLGLRTAEWLVEQGVHHLVLLGRTPLPPRERWEKLCRGATRQAAQLRVLLALEARGATVFTAAVDVADETAVSGVLRQLRADGWPPLRGVIQAAGMPDAQPLVEIQPQRLAEIMYSKVSTGWSLHRAVARERLDFFACFASGAGLLGSPLLASYAAANAFVVALAGYRRSQGLPALAIDWGFWENSHHAGLTECVIHEAIVPQGMGMVTTTEGMAALKYLIEVDAVRTAVLPADLDALCLHHARFATSPLLSCLRATETSPAGDVQAAATAGVPGDSPAAALRAASPEGRRDLAEDYLREQIARVLRLTPERVDVHTSLNNLGIDSLMAVELRNHVQASLGVVIPIARLLQEPTVAQLADVVLEQLDDAGESDHAPPVEAAPVTPDAEPPSSAAEEAQESLLTADALAQFDGLTDDEVDAMLRRMLAEEQQQQN
jgi:acyl transferase domain-containing protein